MTDETHSQPSQETPDTVRPQEFSSGPQKFHREPDMDAELQAELDEALGDMSIDELLAAEEGRTAATSPTGEPVGQGVRRGTVIAIQGDDVFVDLGGKSQGLLPAMQFEDEPLPDVGDTVEVTIEGYDTGEGLLMLSRKGAVMQAAWETLEEGQVVEGRVTGQNKGGLELTISGIRAFMPISQIEMFRVEELGDYVDQKLRCQVTEVDRREKNVIVSRRALLELEAEQKAAELWETLQEGQVVPGTVRSIMPYGAFVDIGGADGLLHVRDMSHSRVEDPASIVAEGQQVQVKILKVDREARRISLGLKQTMPDPWDAAESKWREGDVVTGRVTRLADFGAFFEIEPGVEGLIPISEMSFARRIKHPSEVVSAGDTARVKVLRVDAAQRRISLSLKQAGEDPWQGASVRWREDSVVEGRITRLADFGAFVELAPGVEGLVHVSELSNEFVRSVSEAVREGDAVQAKVLSVDETARRISLSIKQAAEAAATTFETAAEPAEFAPQHKRKKPLKGGLD